MEESILKKTDAPARRRITPEQRRAALLRKGTNRLSYLKGEDELDKTIDTTPLTSTELQQRDASLQSPKGFPKALLLFILFVVANVMFLFTAVRVTTAIHTLAFAVVEFIVFIIAKIATRNQQTTVFFSLFCCLGYHCLINIFSIKIFIIFLLFFTFSNFSSNRICLCLWSDQMSLLC